MQEKSDRTFWRFWGESFTLFVFQDVDGKLSAKCWNALRLWRRGRGSLTHSIEGSCALLVRTKYIADVLGVEMKGSGVPLAPSQQLEDGRFLSGGLFPDPVFLNWADVCKNVLTACVHHAAYLATINTQHDMRPVPWRTLPVTHFGWRAAEKTKTYCQQTQTHIPRVPQSLGGDTFSSSHEKWLNQMVCGYWKTKKDKESRWAWKDSEPLLRSATKIVIWCYYGRWMMEINIGTMSLKTLDTKRDTNFMFQDFLLSVFERMGITQRSEWTSQARPILRLLKGTFEFIRH